MIIEFCLRENETMNIKRKGPGKGPAENFTGNVRIDSLFNAPDPARVRRSSVTFEPGAHTAWPTHPLGQMLIVMSGVGWTQVEGEPTEEIRPGDILWCPPNTRHWRCDTNKCYDSYCYSGGT